MSEIIATADMLIDPDTGEIIDDSNFEENADPRERLLFTARRLGIGYVHAKRNEDAWRKDRQVLGNQLAKTLTQLGWTRIDLPEAEATLGRRDERVNQYASVKLLDALDLTDAQREAIIIGTVTPGSRLSLPKLRKLATEGPEWAADILDIVEETEVAAHVVMGNLPTQHPDAE